MAKKKASVKKANLKKKTPVKKVVKTAVKKAVKKAAVKTAVPKKAVTKKTTKKVAKISKAKISSVKSTPAKAETKVDFSQLLTPLDDRLVVKTSGAEKMTAGGLYIPDTVADVSGNLQGTVVAIGRGHMNKKGHVKGMDVKVGDLVVFADYAGSKVQLQNEDLVILRESEVLGVVSK